MSCRPPASSPCCCCCCCLEGQPCRAENKRRVVKDEDPFLAPSNGSRGNAGVASRHDRDKDTPRPAFQRHPVKHANTKERRAYPVEKKNKNKEAMKVIVTGANGFVGSALVRACLAEPRVTHVFALARRPMPEEAAVAADPKATIVRHDDFGAYPPQLLDQLAGAEGCLW